jgi:hypothetical protein
MGATPQLRAVDIRSCRSPVALRLIPALPVAELHGEADDLARQRVGAAARPTLLVSPRRLCGTIKLRGSYE